MMLSMRYVDSLPFRWWFWHCVGLPFHRINNQAYIGHNILTDIIYRSGCLNHISSTSLIWRLRFWLIKLKYVSKYYY